MTLAILPTDNHLLALSCDINKGYYCQIAAARGLPKKI